MEMRAISSGRGRSSFYQQWVLSVAGGWRHFASTSSESAGGGQAAAQVGVADFSLASKYESSKEGRVYITGLQALVKIPLLVRDRDEERGMKTAGFISGYRGSPLGAYDQNLWIAHQYLSKAGIVFTPGINEEIAATSVWGSQQAAASPGAKFDGVFGIWYGKGPGLDR